MRLRTASRAVIAFGAFAMGCVSPGPEPSRFANVSADKQQPTCSINCPEKSAYPSMHGSVVCANGYQAVCQCLDDAKPLAACEAGAQEN